MSKGSKLRLVNTILILAVAVLIFVLAGILKQGLIDTAAAERYADVQDEVVEKETHHVNFSAVRDMGSPSTSWLYIPDTPVDYPLVQGPDNDFYLDTDAYGKPSKAGAIFINFANSQDLSDAKTVIFGHNMADGSMFSTLHNYSDEEWGNEHQDAYVYMDDNTVRHYKLRYYLFTEPLNEAVYIVSKAEKASDAAVKLADQAEIVYGEYTGGNLICLSTCTYHTLRTVVVFEYVDDDGPVIARDGFSEPDNPVDAGGAPLDDAAATPTEPDYTDEDTYGENNAADYGDEPIVID